MKNFLQDFITGALALLTAISGFLMIFAGIALVLQKPDFGFIFVISTLCFAGLLWLTVKRRGGWGDFVAVIFPWWP